MSRHEGGYRPIFFLVLASGILCYLSMNLMVWSFPLYVGGLVSTPFQVGLVISTMGLTAITLRPYAATWGDRMGRRPLLIIGAAGFAGGPFLYGLAPSLVLVVVGRLVQGVGLSLFTTNYGTLIAEMAPPGRRGQAIGLGALATPISILVGPRLGAAIQSAAGFQPVFFTCAALAAASLAIVALLPGRSLPETRNGDGGFRFLDALKYKGLWAMVGGILPVSLAYGAAVTFFSLFATEQGLPGGDLFFVVFGSALLLVGVAAGHVSDLIGRDRVIVVGMLGLGASLVAVQWAGTVAALLFVALAYGLCMGTARTALDAFTVDCVPASGRASAIGLEYLMFDVGAGMGAIPLGAIAGAAGYGSMFAIVGGICVAGLVVYRLVIRQRPPTFEMAGHNQP